MDIIKMAREMGAAIQQEQEYLDLCAAKLANDQDESLQKMIEEFNALMHKGEMMAAEENADIDEISNQIQDGYDAIMSNPNMVRYNQCKDKIDNMMQTVVAILAGAVNGEDPMTFDPHAHEEHHCGGDCSGCSGCH